MCGHMSMNTLQALFKEFFKVFYRYKRNGTEVQKTEKKQTSALKGIVKEQDCKIMFYTVCM